MGIFVTVKPLQAMLLSLGTLLHIRGGTHLLDRNVQDSMVFEDYIPGHYHAVILTVDVTDLQRA